MVTDIVVTTCDRLEMLKQTLAYIWERTISPYRLQVIDDASNEGNDNYLRGLLLQGKINQIRLHTRRVGISSHLRTLERITTSDPMVFTDDDILLPKLIPDWLSRGLAMMNKYQELGMLALNTPGCNVRHSRGDVDPCGSVTFCRNIPGSFAFVRRSVLKNCVPPDGTPSPVKYMCKQATALGWRIGYLTHVYAQHIGPVSMRNGRDWSDDLRQVQPVNGDTLEPPEAYRW